MRGLLGSMRYVRAIMAPKIGSRARTVQINVQILTRRHTRCLGTTKDQGNRVKDGSQHEHTSGPFKKLGDHYLSRGVPSEKLENPPGRMNDSLPKMKLPWSRTQGSFH